MAFSRISEVAEQFLEVFPAILTFLSTDGGRLSLPLLPNGGHRMYNWGGIWSRPLGVGYHFVGRQPASHIAIVLITDRR